MIVYIVVVRFTNQYVGCFTSLDNIPDIIMDDDMGFEIIKTTIA